MASNDNGANKDEAPEGLKKSASSKLRDFIPIYVTEFENELIPDKHREKRFFDFLKARPSKDWYQKTGFIGRLSPLTFIRRIGSLREGGSRPGFTAGEGLQRFRVPFVRKVNWQAVLRHCKKWIKHPKNVALIIWTIAVSICLLLLFLVMVGALDSLLPNEGNRKRWSETISQILNALFTILCLYEHPTISHHLFLLCRWKSKDSAFLRKTYSKNAAYRRYERAHILFAVILLHITCLAQYTLAGLYWGFTSTARPEWVEYLLFLVAFAAPVIAFCYIFFGPLGKKVSPATDEESQPQADVATQAAEIELRTSKSRKIVVTRPQWIGGLFDCWDDMTVAYLSFFCTFCIFGWNMERLGFGNMYVHVLTFLFLCIAPFFVFYVAAMNVSNEVLRGPVRIIGIILCVFGLFYGGYWRTQMRKRFKLPGNTFLFGYPAVVDWLQWLFCWSCSLAQEVRTGNFYDIEDDSFCNKESTQPNGSERSGDEASRRPPLIPLPRENGVGLYNKPADELRVTVEADRIKSDGPTMTAPRPPQIQLEHNQLRPSRSVHFSDLIPS